MSETDKRCSTPQQLQVDRIMGSSVELIQTIHVCVMARCHHLAHIATINNIKQTDICTTTAISNVNQQTYGLQKVKKYFLGKSKHNEQLDVFPNGTNSVVKHKK